MSDHPKDPSVPLVHRDTTVFELTQWALHTQPVEQRQWLQAARRHDLSELEALYPAVRDMSWLISSVNPVHLFASGSTPHSLHESRCVLSWLLEHGGRLDVVDVYGWLPVNYAAWFGLPRTMDVLLEAGSPVQNATNPQPLDTSLASVAQRRLPGSETCAKLLLMHGADPAQGQHLDPHYGGVTWLTWAIENQRWDWAECLWHKGQKTITEKEMQLLVVRAPSESLAWMQDHDINMLTVLPPSHPDYSMLQGVQAAKERRVLCDAIPPLGEDVADDESGEGGRGRRKM